MSPVSDLTSGRSPVEPLPSKGPGGRSVPPDVELLITEVAALAGLLAQVVELAGRITHRVTGDALLAGHYEVFCGVRLLAASLTDSGRGRCTACAR